MRNRRIEQFIWGPGWPRDALAGQLDALISNLDGSGSKTCQIKDFINFSEGLPGPGGALAAQLDATASNLDSLVSKTYQLEDFSAQARFGWSAGCYNFQFGWFGIWDQKHAKNIPKLRFSQFLWGPAWPRRALVVELDAIISNWNQKHAKSKILTIYLNAGLAPGALWLVSWML